MLKIPLRLSAIEVPKTKSSRPAGQTSVILRPKSLKIIKHHIDINIARVDNAYDLCAAIIATDTRKKGKYLYDPLYT